MQCRSHIVRNITDGKRYKNIKKQEKKGYEKGKGTILKNTNLAIGSILRASARLTQNPAPPVPKVKRTFFYKKKKKKKEGKD